MNLAPAIILIVVAAVVGYVLGIIDSRITASLKKKVEENSAAAAASPTNADQNRLGEHTVLRVTIDQTLKWHLELDKVQVDDPNEISVEQRQRLINLVTQIKPWMDGKSGPGSAPLPTPQAAPERPTLKSLSAVQPVLPPNNPAPKVDALRGLRSLLNNEIKTPGKDKSNSIVTMIDEVLQAKLLGTSLLSKSIRLEEGDMGEVIVFVGKERYSAVDDVPEPEIRAIIKSAISDWEKK
jgi:hypothetical protein